MAYSAGPSPDGPPPAPGRIFHPYTACEEFANGGGMWKPLNGTAIREKMTEAAARLMRDSGRFRTAMLRATTEWPNSCEMALTAEGTNRRAWLGHAGCFLATGSPEECTRLGWHRLSLPQQQQANLMADDVITDWTRKAARKRRGPITSSTQLSIFDGLHA